MCELPTELAEKLRRAKQRCDAGIISTLQAGLEQLHLLAEAFPDKISPQSVEAIKAFVAIHKAPEE